MNTDLVDAGALGWRETQAWDEFLSSAPGNDAETAPAQRFLHRRVLGQHPRPTSNEGLIAKLSGNVKTRQAGPWEPTS